MVTRLYFLRNKRIIGVMKDESKQSNKVPKRGTLEIALASILASIALFGMVQFLAVAVMTLFGVELSWLQYLASLVLLAVGTTIFILGDWDERA